VYSVVKKTILVVIGAGLLFLLGQLLYRALASEETRIGWLLQDAARGFNTCRAGRTLEGFAEDFREKTAHLSRTELRGHLVYLFMTRRHPESKEFRYRVEIEDVRITFASPEESAARVTLRTVFHFLRRKEFKPVWTVEIDAKLEKRPSGWNVVASTHRRVDGKRPF